MPMLTNAYSTYTAVGNREDLIDIITNISPTKTPFMSLTGSGRATARTHEWLTDSLASPASNAHIEGDETASSSITAPSRLLNYTQILKKVFTVTSTQEAVDKAGRTSEIGYQLQNKMKELATDIEFALVVNSAAVSGATGTARQMKGVNGWITTNVSTAGTARDLTATVLDALLSQVWAAGGNPDHILCGGFQKIKIAGFTGNTRWVAAEKNAVYNSVDVYQSPFGTLTVVPEYVMNATNNLNGVVFAVEINKWRKAWLRPIVSEKLAKTGDGEKYHIVAELTLEALNEASSGAVKNLTTS